MKSYKTAKKFDRNDDERKSNVKNKKNEREGVNTQMVVSKLAVLKVSQVFVVDFLWKGWNDFCRGIDGR